MVPEPWPLREADAGPSWNCVVSVVAPVFNEEGNIQVFLERVQHVLDGLGCTHEIVLIDDGSHDATWSEIRRLKDGYPALRAFRLSRNFGHQHALLAGLEMARGDAVITMDSDLQHPPEVIPRLIAEWRKGFGIVLTKRRDRQTASLFKRVTSRCFYRIFSILAAMEIHEGASDFRLMARKPVQELLRFEDASPFLRGSVELLGFPRTIVEFDAAERFSGESKYTLRKMLKFANLALIGHSSVPLKLGIWIGVCTSALAFMELCYILVQVAAGNTVPGWASSVGVTSLLFGVMFIVIGIMGSYIADIHAMLKARPKFIVWETLERGQTVAMPSGHRAAVGPERNIPRTAFEDRLTG
jgi:glycosyltransferase involved in cell wall biosynthesis